LVQNRFADHWDVESDRIPPLIATMSKPDRVDAPRMEFTLHDAVCLVGEHVVLFCGLLLSIFKYLPRLILLINLVYVETYCDRQVVEQGLTPGMALRAC